MATSSQDPILWLLGLQEENINYLPSLYESSESTESSFSVMATRPNSQEIIPARVKIMVNFIGINHRS